MGFVPLAFRAGSARRGRVHIFWQKRIREGDATTPWWFPCDTAGGAMRSDRLVLPIPPGTHWSAVKPPVLAIDADGQSGSALPAPRPKPMRPPRPAKEPSPPQEQRRAIPANGLFFDIPARPSKTPPTPPAIGSAESKRPPRPKAPTSRNNPRLVAAARELRDRWLEQVNATPLIAAGKYDVTRAIAGTGSVMELAPLVPPSRLLPAA